jgi:hypothetical protein
MAKKKEVELEPFEQAKRIICDALIVAGVSTVTADFNGSGDDGQMDVPVCHGAEDGVVITLPDVSVTYTDRQSIYRNGAYEDVDTVVTKKLDDAVNDILYDALGKTYVDWVNNEGGFGEVKMNTATAVIHVDMNQRVESSEHSGHDF